MNTHVLVEAKKEYTKLICNRLSNLIINGFQNIYNNCLTECNLTQDPEVLKSFQQTLKEIPNWGQEIIDKEYDRIVSYNNCDILDELVKAVFITNIRILTATTNKSMNKNIDIDIPNTKSFIHKCYIESAKKIYKDPFLFIHDIPPHEYHKNINNIHKIVCTSIEESIRFMLPVKDILHKYFNNKSINDDQEEDDFNQLLTNNIKDTIQQEMKKFHISQTLTDDNNMMTPPRSPKTPRSNRSPLFPRDKSSGNPTPLMKMLGNYITNDTTNMRTSSIYESNDESSTTLHSSHDDEYVNPSKSNNNQQVNNISERDHKISSSEIYKYPKRHTHTSSNIDSYNQTKSIIFNQDKKREYFPIKHNKYRQRSIQFTIEGKHNKQEQPNDANNDSHQNNKRIKNQQNLFF